MKHEVKVVQKYLSLQQAGQYLGVSAESVRHMLRNGKMPYSKVGGKLFVAVADIDRVMEESRLQSV